MRSLLLACLAVLLPAGEAGAQRAAAPLYSAPVVLFVEPGPAALDSLRSRIGADAFYVTADDAMWYRAEAFARLDSLKRAYRVVERGPMRFRVGGRVEERRWEAVPSSWFVVVYDGEREPVVTRAIDLPATLARTGAGRADRRRPPDPSDPPRGRPK